MKKHSRAFFIFSGIAGFFAMAVVLGTGAMLLWNALVPELFGLPALSWLQAAGLFVLCRLLFGGMSSGFHRGAFDRGGRMRGNLFQGAWNNMTDEQRQHLAEKIQKHRHEHHGFDPRDGLNLRTQNASGDEKTEKKKDE